MLSFPLPPDRGLQLLHEAVMRTLYNENQRALGGPGSGNFGHSGRPGQIGGSAPAEAAPDSGGSGGLRTPSVSTKVWNNPNPQLASEISGVTPDTPIKTLTVYHVTKVENVDSILEKGFDIKKIKPRWVNDRAISFSSGSAKSAAAYFSKTGQSLDTSKYALLEAKIRGRFGDVEKMNISIIVGGAAEYSRRVIASGHDGQDLNKTIYLHNTKAILSVRQIKVEATVRRAEERFLYNPAQPRNPAGGPDGGQWTSGKAIKNVTTYHGGTSEHSAAVTYYTTNKKMAESYVQMSNDRFGSGGGLHQKVLTINNPAPADVIDKEARSVGIDNSFYTPASIFDAELHGEEPVRDLVERLKSKGYDGAVLPDIGYGVQIEDDALIKFRGASVRALDYNPTQPRNPAGSPEGGQWTSTGSSTTKKKAPKAPPVPIESKIKAYDEVKAGATFKETAAKHGMTQGQLAGYVWKVDQKKKAFEEKLKAQPKSTTSHTQSEETGSVVQDTPALAPALESPKLGTQKLWSELSSDEKMVRAHEAGLQWQQKQSGIATGQYAWFDTNTTEQVSSPHPNKEDYRKALDTINYGKGIEAPKPATPSPTGWPIKNDVVRKLGSNYPNKVESAGLAWRNGLTEKEQGAIRDYTGSAYGNINRVLRGKQSSDEYTDQQISRISSALSRSPDPPPPELVWRGVSGDATSFMSKLSTGDVIEMKGFQSTSIKPGFAKNWGDGKVIYEIKPARGAYIRPLSGHSSEYEYLLPHGSKYSVRGIASVKFEGSSIPTKVVQLEMHK